MATSDNAAGTNGIVVVAARSPREDAYNALLVENARLRAALKPFADLVGEIKANWPDNASRFHAAINVGHFRRAAEAMGSRALGVPVVPPAGAAAGAGIEASAEGVCEWLHRRGQEIDPRG